MKPQLTINENGQPILYEFNTHDELDEFYHKLKKSDPDEFLMVSELLKSFDRGFWFRDEGETQRSGTPFEPPKNCPYKFPLALSKDIKIFCEIKFIKMFHFLFRLISFNQLLELFSIRSYFWVEVPRLSNNVL